jgi:NAD(P)-dependent dehydrogenase (short-subunit alcohol dehydrogenase family)
MSFDGKVIAITGAASGIGYQLTLLLAAKGAKLSLADISSEALKKVEDELKSKNVEVLATKLDVTDVPAVNAWIEETVKKFGKLDGGANLAGTEHPFTELEALDDAVWDKVCSLVPLHCGR